MIYEMGKVSALGRNRSHGGLMEAPLVRVDEKIDGSQISFGVHHGEPGDLWVRSRSRFLSIAAPDKMFAAGVEALREIRFALAPGWTYVGEYLLKPKHNVLAYERRPEQYVVLFDAIDDKGRVLDYASLCNEATRLGLEVVQSKLMPGDEALRLARSGPVYQTSQLGGIAEGCVIKAGDHVDNRIIAKVVAEQFKEVKGDRPKRAGNEKVDIAITMANKFCPPARYHKAVQRLKESGEYTGQMRDIPKLREILHRDIEEECGEEIRETLYATLRKDILRMSMQPLSGWYDQYLNSAFGEMKREAEANTGVEL